MSKVRFQVWAKTVWQKGPIRAGKPVEIEEGPQADLYKRTVAAMSDDQVQYYAEVLPDEASGTEEAPADATRLEPES